MDFELADATIGQPYKAEVLVDTEMAESLQRNSIRSYAHPYRELRKIRSHGDFHDYLAGSSIRRYKEIVGGPEKMGSVLGICSKPWEARMLVSFPFTRISLSGVMDQEASVKQECHNDERVTYEYQNAECITHPSASFDLVYCKEGLHHLARPVLGLYEMMRVARKAVIFIEPNETVLGNILEKIGISSTLETNQESNINNRDNYVFRFQSNKLCFLLNSYYLNSGYTLELHFAWMNSRLNASRNPVVREIAVIAGKVAGLVPGSRGNFLTVILQPYISHPCEDGSRIILRFSARDYNSVAALFDRKYSPPITKSCVDRERYLQ